MRKKGSVSSHKHPERCSSPDPLALLPLQDGNLSPGHAKTSNGERRSGLSQTAPSVVLPILLLLGCFAWGCGALRKRGKAGVQRKKGDSRDSNPGPRLPERRIIPLDHYPTLLLLKLDTEFKYRDTEVQQHGSSTRAVADQTSSRLLLSCHSRYLVLHCSTGFGQVLQC